MKESTTFKKRNAHQDGKTSDTTKKTKNLKIDNTKISYSNKFQVLNAVKFALSVTNVQVINIIRDSSNEEIRITIKHTPMQNEKYVQFDKVLKALSD